jgi:glutamate racemase
MLGFFDSGLGGLTVVRRVHELLPRHDLLFFADQAHVPYGDRAPDELLRLLQANMEWLNRSGADLIVMACNTSCAMADRFGWPASRARILDLIESGALAAASGGYRRIAVLATSATARSGAYGRKIRELVPGVRVSEHEAPALVPLVEAGMAGSEAARAAVARACEDVPRDVDAIVLGCTHYPMLDAEFASVFGSAIARVDPAIAHAERTAQSVSESALAGGSGSLLCVSNGDMAKFEKQVRRMSFAAETRFESSSSLAAKR